MQRFGSPFYGQIIPPPAKPEEKEQIKFTLGIAGIALLCAISWGLGFYTAAKEHKPYLRKGHK